MWKNAPIAPVSPISTLFGVPIIFKLRNLFKEQCISSRTC